MDAYYYSFEETGCLDIDKILSAVATAGKAHHHTDEWNDTDDGEPSQIDYIQDAACGAAERIIELESVMRNFRTEITLANDQADMANLAANYDTKFNHILEKGK